MRGKGWYIFGCGNVMKIKCMAHRRKRVIVDGCGTKVGGWRMKNSNV